MADLSSKVKFENSKKSQAPGRGGLSRELPKEGEAVKSPENFFIWEMPEGSCL